MRRSLIYQNQRHPRCFFLLLPPHLQADVDMGDTQGLNTKSFPVHFINGLENPEDKLTILGDFSPPHPLLTNNDTGHYIISLCAVCSVVPSGSFAIMGTQKRASKRRQQSRPSIFRFFYYIFLYESWICLSEYCIYLIEVQCFYCVRIYLYVVWNSLSPKLFIRSLSHFDSTLIGALEYVTLCFTKPRPLQTSENSTDKTKKKQNLSCEKTKTDVNLAENHVFTKDLIAHKKFIKKTGFWGL